MEDEMIGLEYLRKKSDISIADLSNKIGVSRQVITRWENGEQHIPPKRIKELARYFEVDEKYICEKNISRSERIEIEMEQEANSRAFWDKYWDNERKKDSETCAVKDLVDYIQSKDERGKLVWKEFNMYLQERYGITDIYDIWRQVVYFKKTFDNLKKIFSSDSNILKFNEFVYLKDALLSTAEELQQIIDNVSDLAKYADEICTDYLNDVNNIDEEDI